MWRGEWFTEDKSQDMFEYLRYNRRYGDASVIVHISKVAMAILGNGDNGTQLELGWNKSML